VIFHTGGIVDIPFPRSIREALLEEHPAEEHHWFPNSSWITFRVKRGNDLERAFWLNPRIVLTGSRKNERMQNFGAQLREPTFHRSLGESSSL
jgi:hypothetical protein